MKKYLTIPNYFHIIAILLALLTFPISGYFHNPAWAVGFSVAFLISRCIEPIKLNLPVEKISSIKHGFKEKMWGWGYFIIGFAIAASWHFSTGVISGGKVMVLLFLAFSVSFVGLWYDLKKLSN